MQSNYGSRNHTSVINILPVFIEKQGLPRKFLKYQNVKNINYSAIADYPDGNTVLYILFHNTVVKASTYCYKADFNLPSLLTAALVKW